jgi:hypothetical protein
MTSSSAYGFFIFSILHYKLIELSYYGFIIISLINFFTMTTTTTVGAFTNEVGAEKAIISLREAGVMDSDISCLYTDATGTMKDAQTGEKVGSGAVTGATIGATVGAIAGLVVANGILPGVGTLFVAGPIATALGLTGAAATTIAGAATGLAAGGLLGALTSLGITKEDASYYQTVLSSGKYLVIVHSALDSAKRILEAHHSSNVREHKAA